MYVLMIVPSDFPDADAGSVRDMAFAKIYQKLGYDVVLIGMGKNTKNGIIEGVRYYSLYKERTNVIEHFWFYFGYKKRCKRYMNHIINHLGHPALIHINDISHGMINYLVSYVKEKNIPMIHDSTEWYSACEFARGTLDKSYVLKDNLNRKIIRAPIKVIAISKYLEVHFKQRGIQSVRIPVIMDIENTEVAESGVEGVVNMIYAGSPATKDHLEEIVQAIISLPKSKQEHVRVHILGVDSEQLKKLCSVDSLPDCINIYGRVPRERVLEIMRKMDFSLLLRPADERYTKAGFPTKSVEAMSHGVAMMCNLTSDLNLYLKDRENAIIVNDCSTIAFKEALEKVLEMSREEIEVVKQNARRLAELNFDYRSYENTVQQLINSDIYTN